MKSKFKIIACLTAVGLIAGSILYASDHMDSPTVNGTAADITDLYVFEGKNTDNLVFVGNTQGLLTPAASATAKFDENTLIQFSIDNKGRYGPKANLAKDQFSLFRFQSLNNPGISR